MNCLLVYHSKYGQTAKIAKHIAHVLEQYDIQTDLQLVGHTRFHDLQSSFQLVVVGSPIYTGSHSKQLLRFAQKNRSVINEKVTAFFSVSLSAAGDEEQQADAKRCMDDFLQQADWSPSLKQVFAGSLPYRKYNWLIRWIMKRIVRKSGGDTDTSQDFEYTDWDRVTSFAMKLVELVKASQLETDDPVSLSKDHAHSTV